MKSHRTHKSVSSQSSVAIRPHRARVSTLWDDRRRKQKTTRQPAFRAQPIKFLFSERNNLTCLGGVALLQKFALALGVPECLNSHLHLLRRHKPYFESDFILTLAHTLYFGGNSIQDTEYLQNSPAFQTLVGAERVPDPTTTGDFLRRFDSASLACFVLAIDELRFRVWDRLPKRHFEVGTVDLDPTIKPVYGASKEKADFTYTREWGYRPLLVSLAEFQEPLRLVNRPGNVHGGRAAAPFLREALALVQSRFKKLRVRGDSEFYSQETINVCEECRAKFFFAVDSYRGLLDKAKAFPEARWRPLVRKPRRAKPGKKSRRKRKDRRRQKAHARGYFDKKLVREWVTEFPYRPSWSKDKSYRLVAIRKKLKITNDKKNLFEGADYGYEYRFLITNDENLEAAEVVHVLYGRCNQENLIQQLKNELEALRMPTGSFVANSAFMLVGQLVGCLRSWMGRSVLGEESVKWEWKRFRRVYVWAAAEVVTAARYVEVRVSRTQPGAARMVEAAGRIHRFNTS